MHIVQQNHTVSEPNLEIEIDVPLEEDFSEEEFSSEEEAPYSGEEVDFGEEELILVTTPCCGMVIENASLLYKAHELVSYLYDPTLPLPDVCCSDMIDWMPSPYWVGELGANIFYSMYIESGSTQLIGASKLWETRNFTPRNF